jgi:hypothetical protein
MSCIPNDMPEYKVIEIISLYEILDVLGFGDYKDKKLPISINHINMGNGVDMIFSDQNPYKIEIKIGKRLMIRVIGSLVLK